MRQLEQLSLPFARRREIIFQFWDVSNSTSPQDPSRDDPYFSYFEQQCRLARQSDNPETPICSQRNICEIVQQLKAGEDREKIRNDLASKVNTAEEIDNRLFENAINLAVRLWLMVHVGHVCQGVTGQTAIAWREGSLRDVIATHFYPELILADSVKLEKVFNARSIELIAGVNIQWTPNLIDHLRFIEDRRRPVLNIFYHASFLKYHQDNPIFPPGLIDETLRTLALLLPMHDRDSVKWFQKQHIKLKLDPSAISCGQLKLEERQIAHFKYWHDRLVVIKQFFDESQPRTIKQWWFDDRKRVQWFWVAIVLVVCTVLFGIIQCFEGGWQIYKAYYPSR